MKRNWKKTTAFVIALAMCFGGTACGKKEEASGGEKTTAAESGEASGKETGEEELPVLRVSFHSDYINLPLTYAMYNHLDEQYGFKMEASTFTSGAAQNEAMGSDSWDVGVIGSAFAVSCYTYGGYMIGDYISGSDTVALFARKDSDIVAAAGASTEYPEILGSADTVRGKTVLVETGRTQYAVFAAYLEALGLTVDDVNIVEMSNADAFAAWNSGQGDIFPSVGPYSTRLLLNDPENSIPAATMTTLNIPQYDVCVASKSAYENNYDTVVKFMKMVYDCNDILAADPDLMAKTYLQWEEENGITITEEEAKFECSIRPLVTTDMAKKLVTSGAFGTYEKFIVDLYISSGVFPEDLRKILDGQVTSDVMKDALDI